MSNLGDYQIVTVDMAKHGGVTNYINYQRKIGYVKGYKECSEEKNKIIGALIPFAALGISCVTYKLCELYDNKKRATQKIKQKATPNIRIIPNKRSI